MKINDRGLKLIKDFEGLVLTAYECPAGVPTVGYGHTNGVKLGQVITQEQANKLLGEDLEYLEKNISKWAQDCHIPLNEFEFAACVSLAFNIGLNAFTSSTVANKLKVNDRAAAANGFLLWNKADGVVLPGLDRRRIAERSLFLTKVTAMNSTANFTMKFKASSWLKARPVSSAQLGGNEKIALTAGAELNVAAIVFDKEVGHHLLTLGQVNGKQLEYLGRNTWWVFGKDVEVMQGGQLYLNNPVDSVSVGKGKELFIPSIGNATADTPIIASSIGGGFLTWGMATHGGTRMPGGSHVKNIVTIAKRFEQQVKPVLRQHTSQEIHITSWFRPEPYNAQAGGVSNSSHLSGGAIDFWVDPLSSEKVYRLLDPIWDGGCGRYRNGISHLDCSENRRWQL